MDLYRKDTDRNQYLLPSSCHTKQTTTAIPYSLALRIVRTCTDPQNRENCFAEMKTRLLQRGYNLRIVESAIDRARKVPRSAALKCTKPTQSQGPVFAVTYDPRLPAIGSIHARHWMSMTARNPYLAEVFKKPPLIAFKRQQNFR